MVRDQAQEELFRAAKAGGPQVPRQHGQEAIAEDCRQALWLLALAHWDGYRQSCISLAERLSTSADPQICSTVLWSRLIGPDAVADPHNYCA